MKNNWISQEVEWRDDYAGISNFDDYGHGEHHSVSIGDEIEAFDRYGVIHSGVVVGIIRNLNGDPVCYKIWDDERDDFDYVQESDSIVCEPCGSSQWALERIGYRRLNITSSHGYYENGQTGDVIYW